MVLFPTMLIPMGHFVCFPCSPIGHWALSQQIAQVTCMSSLNQFCFHRFLGDYTLTWKCHECHQGLLNSPLVRQGYLFPSMSWLRIWRIECADHVSSGHHFFFFNFIQIQVKLYHNSWFLFLNNFLLFGFCHIPLLVFGCTAPPPLPHTTTTNIK